MRRRPGSLLAILVLSAVPWPSLAADEPAAAVPLAPEQRRWSELVEHLTLSEAERAWREVGWLPSFGDAVARAREEGRPIFLWAMNGHPLGCT